MIARREDYAQLAAVSRRKGRRGGEAGEGGTRRRGVRWECRVVRWDRDQTVHIVIAGREACEKGCVNKEMHAMAVMRS
jgi:hypothetical protein